MISYEAILNKAKAMGFDAVEKIEQVINIDEHKSWGVWEAYKNTDEIQFGMPTFLLTCGNKIRVANGQEVLDIMCGHKENHNVKEPVFLADESDRDNMIARLMKDSGKKSDCFGDRKRKTFFN